MEQNQTVSIFKNEEFGEVRTVKDGDKILFCGSDVAKALGYSNPSKALGDHCKGITKRYIPHPQSQEKQIEMSFITEGDIYRLVARSKLASAERFESWVFDDVLPQLRKTVQRLESIEYSGKIDGLVYTKDGIPTTTSVLIAEKFKKNHKNVLQMIDNKLHSSDESVAEFSATHIHESQYVAGDGQVYRQYELDKQGFSFIALGMTGIQADLFKIEYINAFTKMEEAISAMYKARVIEDVLPQNNGNRQFVYVIKNPLNETVKIGVAHDVAKRMSQLQTGAGVELELIYQSMICSNAFSIERDVHAHFEQYRTFGEWFKISPSEVIDYLENQRYVLKSEYAKYLCPVRIEKGEIA